MIRRPRVILAFLSLVACERSSPRGVTDSTTTVAQTTTAAASVPPADPVFGPFERPAPDSSFGTWSLGSAFVSGSHVRHPSGLLTIWLDTAIRATEDHPVLRAHADSVVVPNLRRSEGLARICRRIPHTAADDVFGIVTDTSDALIRPRLAWRFDVDSFRIRPLPTDSLICMVREPMDEGDN